MRIKSNKVGRRQSIVDENQHFGVSGPGFEPPVLLLASSVTLDISHHLSEFPFRHLGSGDKVSTCFIGLGRLKAMVYENGLGSSTAPDAK